MKVIGIVGGAGSYAGLDLVRKILEQTLAEKDQDHLDVIAMFKPAGIGDRTEFLLDPARPNPGLAIARQALELEEMGAQVAAIPCNTAHSAAIFDLILETLCKANSKLTFLNMIQVTADFLQKHYPNLNQVGVLATTGTAQSSVYTHALNSVNLACLYPDAEQQGVVHQALYNARYGIKAVGHATERARKGLLEAADALVKKGAQVILLACTEIPLAVYEKQIGPAVIVDPTLVLARALVRAAAPEKLKGYSVGGGAFGSRSVNRLLTPSSLAT